MRDLDGIRHLLPQRPPFLFVDRASFDVESQRIRGQHTFMPDEPYFAGHFPGDPIVPGVVLIEGMGQTARLYLNLQAGRVVPGYLVGVEGAMFHAVVRPHQTVTFDCVPVRDAPLASAGTAGAVHHFKCAAFVGERRCARARIALYQSAPRADAGRTESEP